ncbi:hypothetical protein A2U01_0063234, partial [Trifolium medium]|nr:hypothetical protein [Trifolium medium]
MKDGKDFEKRAKECFKLSGGKRMGADNVSRSDVERFVLVRQIDSRHRPTQIVMVAQAWVVEMLAETSSSRFWTAARTVSACF